MDVAKNNFIAGAAQALGAATTMAVAPQVMTAARKVDDFVIEHVRSDQLLTSPLKKLNTLSEPLVVTGFVFALMGAPTIGIAGVALATLIECRSLMHKLSNS